VIDAIVENAPTLSGQRYAVKDYFPHGAGTLATLPRPLAGDYKPAGTIQNEG
jgi:hypothetical protein